MLITITIVQDGKVVDNERLKTWVKSIRLEAGAFIKWKKLNIRGTNRHQEYPYIGNALSDNAQYSDA